MKKIKDSREYYECEKELRNIRNYNGSSVSVKEMKAWLEQLDDNSRLVVTQEGYYAEGNLAEIFKPKDDTTIDGIKYYSIGNSSQNY